jgi:hypothetical protein
VAQALDRSPLCRTLRSRLNSRVCGLLAALSRITQPTTAVQALPATGHFNWTLATPSLPSPPRHAQRSPALRDPAPSSAVTLTTPDLLTASGQLNRGVRCKVAKGRPPHARGRSTEGWGWPGSS